MRSFYQFISLLTLIAVTVACNNQPANTATELAVPVSVNDIRPGSIEKVINTTGNMNATKTTV